MSTKEYIRLPIMEDGEDQEAQLMGVKLDPNDTSSPKWATQLYEDRPNNFYYSNPSQALRVVQLLAILVLCLMSTIVTLGVCLGRMKYDLDRLKTWTDMLTASITPSHYPSLDGATMANFDISGAPDYTAVAEMCAKGNWTASSYMYISCDMNPGGVGNVRNLMLACTRYAIQAGAGLILPRMERRGEDLSDLDTHTYKPLSYLFDTEHFVNTLGEICPQMPILANVSSISDLPTAIIPPVIDPMDLITPNGQYHNDHTDSFRKDIMNYLKAEPAPHTPAIIRLQLRPFEWQCDLDSIEFSSSFGNILKLREDVEILASKVLANLDTWYSMGLNVTNPTPKKGTFAGLHLRTESDFQVIWTNYDQQSRTYFDTLIEMAKENGMNYTHVYAASGNSSETEKLRIDGKKLGLTILTKQDLLTDENDLNYLENTLTWDQAALVDYLVLMRSGWFMGMGLSSFSINIAVSRYGIGGWKGRDRRMSWPRDEWSLLIGGINPVIKAGIWP